MRGALGWERLPRSAGALGTRVSAVEGALGSEAKGGEATCLWGGGSPWEGPGARHVGFSLQPILSHSCVALVKRNLEILNQKGEQFP